MPKRSCGTNDLLDVDSLRHYWNDLQAEAILKPQCRP
jgi:hypothetical protein